MIYNIIYSVHELNVFLESGGCGCCRYRRSGYYDVSDVMMAGREKPVQKKNSKKCIAVVITAAIMAIAVSLAVVFLFKSGMSSFLGLQINLHTGIGLSTTHAPFVHVCKLSVS